MGSLALNAVTPRSSVHTLLIVKDTHSPKLFLVDMDAVASVIPASFAEESFLKSADSFPTYLEAAKGSLICVFDSTSCILHLKFLGDSSMLMSILLRLVVICLVWTSSVTRSCWLKCVIVDWWILHAWALCYLLLLHHLCFVIFNLLFLHKILLLHSNRFLALTEPRFSGTSAKHGVYHRILISGQPVWAHPQCLDPSKLHTAKMEFESMVHMGIMRPLSSQ